MPTQVFSLTNVAIQAAPPTFFVPSVNGVAVPAGLSTWTLLYDLGGTIPTGQLFNVTVEYQRNQWTDAAGVSHPAGEWLPDVGGVSTTGPHTDKAGNTTTIGGMSSTIGAVNGAGGMVEPYPTHVRMRIDQSGNWTLPSVTLTLN